MVWPVVSLRSELGNISWAAPSLKSRLPSLSSPPRNCARSHADISSALDMMPPAAAMLSQFIQAIGLEPSRIVLWGVA